MMSFLLIIILENHPRFIVGLGTLTALLEIEEEG